MWYDLEIRMPPQDFILLETERGKEIFYLEWLNLSTGYSINTDLYNKHPVLVEFLKLQILNAI
jgi:hypothetical protein